ncbi:hypothetical protein PRCB_10875 [Pantoea rodasii]|uniref:Uncharacterized protein n=1 Tax=Pantoea rodasii TaxID=1076549 RepID=A0A2M9WDJ6_9GAMM|nr:hypothetical protein HA45_20530 [Pantoea rodasii]PJZ05538.1 hypothetical protein PRCB_10875 [Pantoea rodasii]
MWTDITRCEPAFFQRIVVPDGIMDMEATYLGYRRVGQYHARTRNNKPFNPVIRYWKAALTPF